MIPMPTILIVDDDAVVRGILLDLFSGTYECNSASTTEEAFEFLKIEDYDAVITDIAMPGLDGLELLRCVQQKNPNTPVILISGKGSEEDSESFIHLGAFAYVTKPFSLEHIEELVQRAVSSKD